VAVASLDLKNGASRRARQGFREAVEGGTDNALAQIEWASRQLRTVHISNEELSGPRVFEARAKRALAEGRWDDALAEARRWQEDEPFSAHPVQLQSFVLASVFNDYAVARRLLLSALEINPRNGGLLNDLAYSEAMLGHVAPATQALARVDASTAPLSLHAALVATGGLILIRGGALEKGREYYLEAARIAAGANLFGSECVALANLAREEALAGDTRAQETYERLINRAEKNELSFDPLIRLVLERTEGLPGIRRKREDDKGLEQGDS